MIMRTFLKQSFFKVEELAAILAGILVRPFPASARTFFISATYASWRLPERMRILVTPFLMELGRASLDGTGPLFITRDFNGFTMELDIAEKTQRNLFFFKTYEAGITEFFRKNLAPDDMVIDVGANVGYYTLLAASCGAQVTACEPEAHNYARLMHHVAMNHSNANCLRIALGDASGTMTLHINPLNHGGNSLLAPKGYKTGAHHYTREEMESAYGKDFLEEEVEVRTLDSLVTKPVALLKIDVEGFEAHVFAGMTRALEQGLVKHIICELGNSETRADIIHRLKQYGYRAYSIAPSGDIISVETGRDLLFTHFSINP
jgi:FkbM family methyltransferase